MNKENCVSFEVVGFESPEIVADLRRVFGSRGISIASLSHKRLSAPMTGDALFSATIIAHLPSDLSRKKVQHAIEDLSSDITVCAKAA